MKCFLCFFPCLNLLCLLRTSANSVCDIFSDANHCSIYDVTNEHFFSEQQMRVYLSQGTAHCHLPYIRTHIYQTSMPQWLTRPGKVFSFSLFTSRNFEPYINILRCEIITSVSKLFRSLIFIFMRCYCVKCWNVWFILFCSVLARSRQDGKSNHKSLLVNTSNVNSNSTVGKIAADKYDQMIFCLRDLWLQCCEPTFVWVRLHAHMALVMVWNCAEEIFQEVRADTSRFTLTHLSTSFQYWDYWMRSEDLKLFSFQMFNEADIMQVQIQLWYKFCLI